MSEFSHHLTPARPGVEIQGFRVTGLPDPIVGSDAVPLRLLSDSVGGVISRILALTLTLDAPAEDYALVPLVSGASPVLCQVWVPSFNLGRNWQTDMQVVDVSGQRHLKISFAKGIVPDGRFDLVMVGNW